MIDFLGTFEVALLDTICFKSAINLGMVVLSVEEQVKMNLYLDWEELLH